MAFSSKECIPLSMDELKYDGKNVIYDKKIINKPSERTPF